MGCREYQEVKIVSQVEFMRCCSPRRVLLRLWAVLLLGGVLPVCAGAVVLAADQASPSLRSMARSDAGPGSQTLILVHGYQSGPSVWYDSGVVAALSRAGWINAGILHDQGGVVGWELPLRQLPSSGGAAAGQRRFVAVSLPDEAPIAFQARWLTSYVQTVKQRFPGSELILAGHSAGAVVSRMVMVQHPEFGVSMLVSIAGPNHGAGLAGLGRAISDSPLGMVAPFMGLGTVNRSRGLYEDLNENSPNSAIRWLNQQPHPQARYVAVIHQNPGGSQVVELPSQGLLGIPGLRSVGARGGVSAYPVRSGHSLGPVDGQLLVWLLKE